MTCLFVLIDSRLAPQAIDLEFTEWLGENGVPFAIVFTKGRQTERRQTDTHINEYLEQLKEQWEELLPTSSPLLKTAWDGKSCWTISKVSTKA